VLVVFVVIDVIGIAPTVVGAVLLVVGLENAGIAKRAEHLELPLARIDGCRSARAQ
jgi:hypothetical protein